ncbi:MAG: hypothetical protein ACJ8C4_15140 [Gemmataceae bacterium]
MRRANESIGRGQTLVRRRASDVLDRIRDLEERVDDALAPIAAEFETALAELEGVSVGAANADLTRRIRQLLDRLMRKVVCPGVRSSRHTARERDWRIWREDLLFPD